MTHSSRDIERQYGKLSPFELKAKLLALAEDSCRRSTTMLLDAGRGNPNWVATTPREAFFLLGRFALDEARATWSEPGLAGLPQAPGIAGRLGDFLDKHGDEPGAQLLADVVAYGVDAGFVPDAWVYELTDGVIGDHYPGPDRMLVHTERIVRDYLVAELCEGHPTPTKLDLFAVEGGTAAMCYLFDSLTANGLLARGDRVAVLCPTFTPYLEIPRLDRYGFEVVELFASQINVDGEPLWQFPDDEIDKLADPSIKAVFVVNPSNPPSVMLAPGTVDRLRDLVRRDNPNLIIVTDDVYATFVAGFRSLLTELPENTIVVYSFSKYFGCTGWRLGVVGLTRDNVIDRRLQALPDDKRQALDERYSTISLDPSSLPFIDRMVADSRQVALNHTAGLSLPQQIQMVLFAASALVDRDNRYRTRTRRIIQRRIVYLFAGMKLDLLDDPLRAGYYAEIDLVTWARHRYGGPFTDWLMANRDPIEPVFRLAEEAGIVVLNGGGFEGPVWSIRVSLANLPDHAYHRIGKELIAVFDDFEAEFRQEIPQI